MAIKEIVTQTVTLEIFAASCCGGFVAMTAEQISNLQKNGQTFWCPFGHGRSWGESEAEKLKKRLESKDRELEYSYRANGQLRDTNEKVKKQLASEKGRVTKLKNRAKAGLCTLGCNRHFTNLENHIASKHGTHEERERIKADYIKGRP